MLISNGEAEIFQHCMLRNKQLTPYNNFRLPCPPLAKRGSLTHSQALALSKRARDVTALLGARNRYAIRLAGHQSPRHGCAGWDRQAVMGISLQLYC